MEELAKILVRDIDIIARNEYLQKLVDRMNNGILILRLKEFLINPNSIKS